MTIDHKNDNTILTENRGNVSALSLGNEFRTGEELLPFIQGRITEEFIYSPLGKAFEKQVKTI